MFRNPHALEACLAIVVSVFAFGLYAAPANAAATCHQRVLTDWSDNGRVDKVYPLRCYEEAIDALPLDLRDYTNAEDVIGRALTIALRQSPSGVMKNSSEAAAIPGSDSARASLPLPLMLAAGVSLALLAAGGLGYVSRRRRSAD
jgi:hypothetical protein